MEASCFLAFLKQSWCQCISPFPLLRQVLLRVVLSADLFFGPGRSSLTSEGVVCRFTGSSGVRNLKLPLLWNFLVQPHVRKFHRGLDRDGSKRGGGGGKPPPPSPNVAD